MNMNINTSNMNIGPRLGETIMSLGAAKSEASSNTADILGVLDNGEMPASGMTSTTVATAGIVEGATDIKSLESELASKAQLAKANLTNLFNKLTTSDVKAMDENKLSSLDDEEVDKVVNVVEEIKIMLATYCKDYIPTGNIDVDEIKEITGNASMAAKVIKKFQQSNIPVTKENVMDTMNTAKEYENLTEIDENAKRYLIQKDMEPTIENLYKASHSVSTGTRTDKISDSDLKALEPQMEKLIKDSGFEVNDANKTNAKLILKEGKALDENSLYLAKSIDEADLTKNEDEIIDSIVEAFVDDKRAGGVSLNPSQSSKEKAINAYDTIKNASATDIIRITNELMELTVANLRNAQGDASYNSDNEAAYIKNFAVLEHAKLTLSAGAMFTMDKLGIKIDTTTLSKLAGNYENLDESKAASQIYELHDTPVDALSITFAKSTFTIRETIDAGYEIKWKAVRASMTYETFGTQVRGDLGDRLNDAVSSSAGNMLDNMGLDADEANLAAVKILAANSMEVTAENVSKMASDYGAVMNIARNLSPRLVMDMIRNKINPLTTDVYTLSDYVDRYDRTEETKESYAKFLYKLDVKGEISEEERADYIGIYRVLSNIAKDEGKSIGATVKAGEDLVLENVIRQYISKKHGRIDAAFGENTSFKAGDGRMSYYTSIFKDCVSMEERPLDDSYYSNQVERVREAASAENDVLRVLTDNNEPVTINNVIAAMDFRGNKIYRKLEEIESVDVKKVMDDIYESMDDEEKLSGNYDRLVRAAEEATNASIESDTVTYAKMRDIDDVIRSTHLLASLAKKREYKIPVYDNGKLVNVNLKIISGKQQGRMNISFESETYGRLSIDCKAGEKNFDAFAISDSESGEAALLERIDELENAVRLVGYENVTFTCSYSETMSELTGSDEGGTTGAMLYRAAKTIIASLI